MIIRIPKILVDNEDSINDLTINLIGNRQAKIKFDGIYNGETIPVYYAVTDVGQFQLDMKSKSVKSSIRMIDMSTRKPFLTDISISLQGVIITIRRSGASPTKVEITKGSNPAVILQQLMTAIR